MKFQEMEYVIAVAKNNSFSKAAEELYVSQPNVSSTITSLEEKLAFKIFKRSNKGIEVTKKGAIFLRHAGKILKEYKKIETIDEGEPYHSFSIQSMFNHTALSRAFVKLCAEYQDKSNLDFSIHSGSSKEIIDNIYMGQSQLGIVLMNQDSIDTNLHLLPKKGLKLDILKEMTINVNLRLGHPLLEKQNFDFYDLYDYPFAHYYDLDSPESLSMELVNISDSPINSVAMINPSRIISVDGRDTRSEVVVSTNAFSVGCSFHPRTTRLERIMSIPIPNLKSFLVAIYKQSHSNTEEFISFNSFFKKELAKF